MSNVVGAVFEKGNGTVLTNDYGKIPSGYSTSLYEGDFYKTRGGEHQRAEAGQVWDGIWSGCEFRDAQGIQKFQKFWTANTVTYNAVAADSTGMRSSLGILKIKANNESSSSNRLAAGDMGSETVDIEYGTGDSVNGSAMVIDQSTKGTGSGQLRVLRLVEQPDNETHGNGAIYECEPAEQAQNYTTGQA